MFKVTCYKAVLSHEHFIQLSINEITDRCQYDYTIEVTPEIYYATRQNEIRFLSDKVCDTGEGVIVAYYFTKAIEVGS